TGPYGDERFFGGSNKSGEAAMMERDDDGKSSRRPRHYWLAGWSKSGSRSSGVGRRRKCRRRERVVQRPCWFRLSGDGEEKREIWWCFASWLEKKWRESGSEVAGGILGGFRPVEGVMVTESETAYGGGEKSKMARRQCRR
ncbi:hypothetical protein HAX54_044307, partial [Datura stramonium]|nr:hypothetical protein [Datura stramonium]